MRPSQTKPSTEKKEKDDSARKADVFAVEGSTADRLRKRRLEQEARLKEIMGK